MSSFSERLLAWFDQYGRKDLPWQQQRSPYAVWVSEIMLQQTQVNTVIPYYLRFMQQFPDIHHLAAAEPDEVLALWTGLGYYARARNLHKSAQIIVNHYQGQLPDDLDTLITLPGIGRSTAGAIMALAWHQPCPILDGNVKRVLTRFYAIKGWPGIKTVENRLWTLAEQLLPTQRVADYIQAQMDLGATVCTRHHPRCDHCPLQPDCEAYLLHSPHHFPNPRPRKKNPEKTIHWLICYSESKTILLEQRPPAGIWGGLWSFPERDSDDAITEFATQQFNIKIKRIHSQPAFAHIFTHFRLNISPHLIICRQTGNKISGNNRLRWYRIQAALQLGLPAPVKAFLQSIA